MKIVRFYDTKHIFILIISYKITMYLIKLLLNAE